MTKSRILLIAATIMISLFAIVGLILYLAVTRVITPEMALLLLVGLLGCYVGCGVLIMVYRFVHRLD